MPYLTTDAGGREVSQVEDEMHTGVRKIGVNFEGFYGFKPSRVDSRFTITLSDLSYLPKVDRAHHITPNYAEP